MSVKNVEKVEKSQVALTIEVGAAEFEAAIEKAYQKMRKKINVQGFRPGKAPRKMIEKMYGAEVFFEEAINTAFPEAYDAAIKEQELKVVGYPEVEMVGECTKEGFTFKAVVPVYLPLSTPPEPLQCGHDSSPMQDRTLPWIYSPTGRGADPRWHRGP